ncbi:MAG: RIP metalloprotease RseP, partial [Gammaproteobacteria bacterium]|nr:RIP metalloprotease RseP [Gammaproteobacteria bacterium]
AGAIETDSIKIAVRDQEGFNRNAQLNLSTVDTENTKIKLLDQLGIKPFSPVLPAVIGQVLAGEPAAQAGFEAGDRILKAKQQAISSWSDWVDIIRDNPERSLAVDYERNGQVFSTTLIPAMVESGDKKIGRIGAAAEIPEGFLDQYQARERYGPLDALKLSVEKTWDFSVLTLKVLGKILIGEASVNNLSGPITIAQTAGKSASIGYMYFLKFLAIVSISLGVLNLLPIPVLDGGHLFFFLLEAIKGSALSESFIEQGQRIGFALLIALMGVAFYVDLNRFFN